MVRTLLKNRRPLWKCESKLAALDIFHHSWLERPETLCDHSREKMLRENATRRRHPSTCMHAHLSVRVHIHVPTHPALYVRTSTYMPIWSDGKRQPACAGAERESPREMHDEPTSIYMSAHNHHAYMGGLHQRGAGPLSSAPAPTQPHHARTSSTTTKTTSKAHAMPWKTAIHGHCACGRCRYTLDPSTTTPKATLDALKSRWNGQAYEAVYCHCTDCRRATSALLCAWLSVPVEWLHWNTPPSSSTSTSTPTSSTISTTTTDSTSTTTAATAAALKTYTRDNGVKRTFCGECGTSFTYSSTALAETGELSVDVLLATLADEDLTRLEELGLKPAKHLFWGSGVACVKELVRHGGADGGEEKELAVYEGGTTDEARRISL